MTELHFEPLYAVPWFPLFVLSVHHISFLHCLFYKFALLFLLISFNLNLKQFNGPCTNTTFSETQHIFFFFFFCACSFFIARVVMHSAQNLMPLFCPNMWSDVAHFVCVNILSCWLLVHVFGFIFTVHESLICPCSSHHRPPIPQH